MSRLEVTRLPVVACVAEDDLAGLRAALTADGAQVLTLDGHGVVDRDTLFARIERDLPCAGYAIGGWDALADALWNGLAGLAAGEQIAIVWTGADAMLAHALGDLVTASIVFAELARQVARTDKGFPRELRLRVVLCGRGPNFPRLPAAA